MPRSSPLFLPLLILILLAGLSVTGCVRVHRVHGNFLEEEKLHLVQPGMSKDDVVKTLGPPSTYGLFQDNTWIYMGTRESHVAFSQPRLDASRLFSVVFDKDGRVADTKRYEPKPFHDISLSSRETEDLTHRRTIMQAMFGNVGRFNKGDAVKPRIGSAGGL